MTILAPNLPPWTRLINRKSMKMWKKCWTARRFNHTQRRRVVDVPSDINRKSCHEALLQWEKASKENFLKRLTKITRGSLTHYPIVMHRNNQKKREILLESARGNEWGSKMSGLKGKTHCCCRHFWVIKKHNNRSRLAKVNDVCRSLEFRVIATCRKIVKVEKSMTHSGNLRTILSRLDRGFSDMCAAGCKEEVCDEKHVNNIKKSPYKFQDLSQWNGISQFFSQCMTKASWKSLKIETFFSSE